MKIYLDHAATTQIDEQVIDVMHQLMQTHYGNPSSIHESGRKSRVIIEQARIRISGLLKVNPAEIFFTSGGTESINTLISGMLQNPAIKKIITSPIEHPAMLRSIEYFTTKQDIEVIYLKVNKKLFILLKLY